jgi:hypothetical protein
VTIWCRKREVSGRRIVFFIFFFFVLSQALEAAKSGLVLFHEAMDKLDGGELEESFARFERAAAKGHEESIWIVSVVKDVAMLKNTLKEAFAKTQEPLGWYFAGRFAPRRSREEFDFCKKSAEAGCSWGQVWYGWYFGYGKFVEEDEKAEVEWYEKAVMQNNPKGMGWLGDTIGKKGGDKEKVVAYHRAAAELGWKYSMGRLARELRDLRQAVVWGAQSVYDFQRFLRRAREALESGLMEDLGCDFNQLCYLLGGGLYWYQYGSEWWNGRGDEDEALGDENKAFGNRCLDYYCSCVELQQKSIFTFLLCWNRTTGVKGPGQMIAQMVWEEREDNLVKMFEESDGELERKRMVREGREDNLISQLEQPRRSARLKRIKR